MGIAQAGLAFRLQHPVADFAATLSRVFDEPAIEIPSPVGERFDIREHPNVMLQVFDQSHFLCNDDLAALLLDDVESSGARIHRALGQPALLIAFRHDDETGRYGYAVFERGIRRRTRTQATDEPSPGVIHDAGRPLRFERRWLTARHLVRAPEVDHPLHEKIYYLGNREVLLPERLLTARMLREGLETHFGICPWETLITPAYRFFQLEPTGARAPDAARPPFDARPRLRPWWMPF